jgi:hypothetical protein
MNNLKEIKTTITGAIFLLVGLGIFLHQYYMFNNLEWQYYLIPFIFMAGGVALLLAPDRILDLVFKAANKKVNGK